MNKVLQLNQQPAWLARLVELVMQLRVDVKKELPEQLKKLLQGSGRRNEPTGQPSLWKVELREHYDVRSKLGRGANPLQYSITIEFSLSSKRNSEVEVVEIWKFNVKREPPSERMYQGRSLQQEFEMERMLADLIQTIFKLPLWQDYWGDIENRRTVKQNFILNYKISYVEEPLPVKFVYDCKIGKLWRLPQAILSAKIYYSSKPSSLGRSQPPKKELEKTVLCHKMSADSHSTRKRSVYEYYDDQLDVTFVSSEGEFNLGENSMSEVTLGTPCEEESDQQYELIVESPEEVKLLAFQKELQRLKERATTLDTTSQF